MFPMTKNMNYMTSSDRCMMKKSPPVDIIDCQKQGSSQDLGYVSATESLTSSYTGFSQANSEGYRTPPRRIPSWSESSGSPRSYSPFNKDISYAGARFDEPPSPRVLPMPPVSWIPASPAPPSQRREVMELGLKKLLGIEK